MQEKLKMYAEPPVVVPKQKVPAWIRWPIRLIAYPFMMLDLLAQKITYLILRPKYKLVGQCKKRGACCNYIHMGWSKDSKFGLFFKIYVFWQTEILGFYFKSFDFVEEREVTKVMGCRYLKSDGSCSHYRLRPGICRTWPKLHPFREPTLLKGCGYRAELKKKS